MVKTAILVAGAYATGNRVYWVKTRRTVKARRSAKSAVKATGRKTKRKVKAAGRKIKSAVKAAGRKVKFW